MTELQKEMKSRRNRLRKMTKKQLLEIPMPLLRKRSSARKETLVWIAMVTEFGAPAITTWWFR